MEYGSERALSRALANIDRWYPVVGISEHMELSLSVFERKLPQFFDGAVDLFTEMTEEENSELS